MYNWWNPEFVKLIEEEKKIIDFLKMSPSRGSPFIPGQAQQFGGPGPGFGGGGGFGGNPFGGNQPGGSGFGSASGGPFNPRSGSASRGFS